MAPVDGFPGGKEWAQLMEDVVGAVFVDKSVRVIEAPDWRGNMEAWVVRVLVGAGGFDGGAAGCDGVHAHTMSNV